MTETDLRRALLRQICSASGHDLPDTYALAAALNVPLPRVGITLGALVSDGYLLGVSCANDTNPYDLLLTGVTSKGRRTVEENLSVWNEPMSKYNLNVHSAQTLQVGDNNTLNVQQVNLERLYAQIDRMDAPPEEKAKAKGLLAKVLENPLVAAAFQVVLEKTMGG